MSNIDIRHLTLPDLGRLMILEKKQWDQDQLPTEKQLAQRIICHPELCFGAFCIKSDDALASLFLKPVNSQKFAGPITWQDCARVESVASKKPSFKTLFGISFTSIDPLAADLIFAHGYGYLLKRGCHSIVLGSPIPGYKKAYEKDGIGVEEYVNRKHPFRSTLPYDPQLRYYHSRGFRHIISIQKDYFPHEPSCNYGVIIEGRVPLRKLSFLWRLLPESWIGYCCRQAVIGLHRFSRKPKRYITLTET